MVRFLVVVLAMLGAASFSYFFPALRNVAFAVAGFGITWVMLLAVGAGFTTYKVTK